VLGLDQARPVEDIGGQAHVSGIDQLAPIGDADFGTMFIVTVPRIGRANLLRMEY